MKKPLIAILVGLIIGGIGFGGYLAWLGSQPKPTEQQAPAATASAEFLTWRDPNGFTFDYPEGLTVDKHDEDQQNYAHIEFTHPDHPGNIIVWAKDTTAADVSAWAKTEKRFKDANILDTTFANFPGKKVLIADPKQVIVGTINDEIVWTVEGLLTDSDYWSNVLSTIADTFKFNPLAEESTDSVGGAIEEISADEEEVLE